MSELVSKKGFNIKAFFFPAGYYGGYGKVKKGLLLAVIGSIPVLFAIVPFYAGFKANKELTDANFSWFKGLGVFAVHIFLLMIVWDQSQI